MRTVFAFVTLSTLAVFAACSSSSNGTSSPAPTNDAGSAGNDACADGGCSTPVDVSIEGDVLAFLTEVRGPRIQNAKVSILEHPELTFTTTTDAHFKFDHLKSGEPITLVVEEPSITTTQSATYTLGTKGIAALSVQVVPTTLFTSLASLMPQAPELDKYCAIASTVARMGASLYTAQRQGLPGVAVTLDPPVDASSGPFYFNEAVVPSTVQVGTSIDGGVLFYRLPPGQYTMSASMSGHVFNSVKLDCRAGFVVNAGPPLGLLADVANPDYAAGVGRPDDAYSASSDNYCEQTATCVNESDAGTPTSYPPATLASCKVTYRNWWSYVDLGCDGTSKVRDAAKAFYDCRASTCDNALGEDLPCVDEEAAFRAADTTYGACVAAK